MSDNALNSVRAACRQVIKSQGGSGGPQTPNLSAAEASGPGTSGDPEMDQRQEMHDCCSPSHNYRY